MKLDRPTIGELIDYLSTIRKKMTYVITEDKKKGVIRVTATLGNYHVHAIGSADVRFSDPLKAQNSPQKSPCNPGHLIRPFLSSGFTSGLRPLPTC